MVETLKTYDASHGPALGLFANAKYPVGQFPISVDDLLVLYTDGLYEVHDGAQEEYGQERLLQAVRSRVSLPPEQLFDEILADVKRFSAGKDFDDDVCLVGVEVEWLGAMPGSRKPQ